MIAAPLSPPMPLCGLVPAVVTGSCQWLPPLTRYVVVRRPLAHRNRRTTTLPAARDMRGMAARPNSETTHNGKH